MLNNKSKYYFIILYNFFVRVTKTPSLFHKYLVRECILDNIMYLDIIMYTCYRYIGIIVIVLYIVYMYNILFVFVGHII